MPQTITYRGPRVLVGALAHLLRDEGVEFDQPREDRTDVVERTVIRVRGQGLRAKELKTRSSARVLMLPDWCVRLLESRREQSEGKGPVFPDARGGFRDRNNVAAAYRKVREGTPYEWVTPHTYRRTVATLLDGGGASARLIADQLGHSRVSMTQDHYMGRKSVASQVADVLNLHDPDRGRDGGEASA